MDATLIEQLFSVQPSAFSVSLWLTNLQQQLTTETQRTQRLHREQRSQDFLWARLLIACN